MTKLKVTLLLQARPLLYRQVAYFEMRNLLNDLTGALIMISTSYLLDQVVFTGDHALLFVLDRLVIRTELRRAKR